MLPQHLNQQCVEKRAEGHLQLKQFRPYGRGLVTSAHPCHISTPTRHRNTNEVHDLGLVYDLTHN